MTSSRMTKLGIARESSFGSSAAPQVLLPVEAPAITEPYEQILDQLYRGVNALDYGAYQGTSLVEMSLSTNFYPEEIGYLIMAMIGDPNTGTGPPYEHVFNQEHTPPSLSIQDEGAIYLAAATKRRYLGMLPSSLVLGFNAGEGLLTVSCDLTGQRGTAPVSGDIPGDASTTPFRGWQAEVKVAGTDYLRLMDAEITLARELGVRYAADRIQYPGAIYSGALEVTVSMTVDGLDSTELGYYAGHTTNALWIRFLHGTGATQKSISFEMTSFNWGEGPVELDRSGVFVTQGISGRALYNTTDAGPIEIILRNAREAYVT